VHDNHLFLALAEGLKQPLLQIARQAELQAMRPSLGSGKLVKRQSSDDVLRALGSIQATADMSLHMLDSYLLSLRLASSPALELEREPISLSAVLHDTAQELRDIAASYGVTLHLHVDGRYEPVLAHRQALQAALTALGYALIEALPASGASAGHQRLQLATHRTRHGLVAGLYGELDGLTPQAFERSKELQGTVRQPLVGSLQGSGAGVFVADAILAAMASRLRVGRFHRLPGFAVTLPATEQLQLI
jgi:hypothetical protein